MTTRTSRDCRSHNDREEGEALVVSVDGMLDEHLGSELGPELLGRLQLEMLQALYLELRHGHDQQAAHTRAITRQTEALGHLAGEINVLRRRLGNR